MTRLRSTRIVILAIFLCLLAAESSTAGTVDVSADGETFIVDGAVIHHSRFENDRTEAATCTTCHWRIHLICRSWSDTAHGACPSLASGCPADQSVAEVFRADALTRPDIQSSLWHLAGHTCIGSGGPASVVLIREALRKRWRIRVPPLLYATSPPVTTLLNLETFIQFSSPASLPDQTQTLVGIPVTFRARSQRSVSCSPACTVDFVHQSLTPLVAGSLAITATASWTATYDALGLKNLAAAIPPIVQRNTRRINVLRLHRSLVVKPR